MVLQTETQQGICEVLNAARSPEERDWCWGCIVRRRQKAATAIIEAIISSWKSNRPPAPVPTQRAFAHIMCVSDDATKRPIWPMARSLAPDVKCPIMVPF
jgi:hypothetical protein